jgi:VWFA-related protein
VVTADRAPEVLAPAGVRDEPWPVLAWLAVAWAIGTVVGLLQIGRSAFLAWRTRQRAAELVEPDWTSEVEDAARVLGLRRGVRLLMSDAVRVPVVHGFRPPAILLPTSAVSWPEDRRRAFLLHELAHVRRQDWPIQMLGHLARALYWPHPLAWWVARRLRIEAERASDDCVLRAGMPAPDYADHLLQAARDLGGAPRQDAVLAVVERSHFEDRLMALLDPQVSRRALDRRVFGFGTVMALTCVIGVAGLQPVARARAQAPESDRPRDRAVRSEPVPREPRASRLDDRAAAAVRASVPSSSPSASPANGSLDPGESDGAREPASEGEEPIPLEGETGPDETPWPLAQPTPPPPATPVASVLPVIRISTDMVQIDAVVTDKDGKGVVDLRPEDIEVFEDGRKQTVTHLQYVAAGPGTGGGKGVGTPAASPTPGEPRAFVFVVDNLGLSLEGTARARRLVQSFVTSGLQPRDRAAIIETSATAGGTFALTSDPKVLSEAAGRIHHIVWGRAGLGSFGGREIDLTSRNDQLVLDSLAVLKTTVDALRALPGRKSVILVSDGLTSRISIDMDRLLQRFTSTPLDSLYGDTTLYAALRSLTDLANRASVVIYTLDSTGLQTSSGGQVQTFGARWNPGDPRNGADTRDANGELTAAGNPAAQGQLVRSVARTTREDSLIEIAEQTGGLAVFSTNDLAGGLARIVNDLSGYYLIGYVPDQATFESRPGPPRFHSVKVEVKRPGLKVRSRKGFYGVTDEFVAQASPPR